MILPESAFISRTGNTVETPTVSAFVRQGKCDIVRYYAICPVRKPMRYCKG